MKRYEKYTSAMYEWLPNLPENWRQLFLQQVCHEKKIKNIDMKEHLVLSLSYGYIIRKKNVSSGLIARDLSTYQIVMPNDIILRFTDLQNDRKSLRTGLVNEKGIISSAYVCITPMINASYLHYVLHYYDIRKVFYGMGSGVRQSIGFSEIRHMFIPVPPRDEQDQIVRFLDWKVSKINRLINMKIKQINLIKKRELISINRLLTTGTDKNCDMTSIASSWMSVIPSHWELSRIGNYFEIRKRIAGKEGYPVLSITQQGLKKKDISTNEGQMAANYSGYQFVYEGDFAMNPMDLITGYIDRASAFGVTSPDYRVFSLIDEEKCYAPYYLLLFQLCYKRRIFYAYGKGAATKGRWRMPAVNFKNFVIPLPPIDEQKRIVDAIEPIQEKINNAIENISKQIELLREMKASLISDVVTGQIDVRGVKIPEYERCEEKLEDADAEPDAAKIEEQED